MTITAAPKSTSVRPDGAFGVPLIAAGIGCLVLLGLSDARGPVSFPPDDSLYSVQNWVQAVAIVAAGLLIAVPKVSKSAKAAASGLALVSAGMLLGTALWAMKHWASYRGTDGLSYKRTNDMEQLTVFIAAASLVAGAMALLWLANSRSWSTHSAPNLRQTSIITGVLTMVSLPLFVGLTIGEPDAIDVTSLGTYALLFSLPWGLSFVVSAYLIRPAAIGALAAAATSIGIWALRALFDDVPLVGAGFCVVLLVGVWLITLQWRGGRATRYS